MSLVDNTSLSIELPPVVEYGVTSGDVGSGVAEYLESAEKLVDATSSES